MKYFGKGSLSSTMRTLLQIGWYLAWLGGAIAIVLGFAIVFHAELGSPFAAGMKTSSAKDIQDWQWFQNLPLIARVWILPYFGGVMGLVVAIIGKARKLFGNFRDELVFDPGNVLIIRNISRLAIALSILSFSFGTFLFAIILLLLCEILKNGTALKEEQDLTI